VDISFNTFRFVVASFRYFFIAIVFFVLWLINLRETRKNICNIENRLWSTWSTTEVILNHLWKMIANLKTMVCSTQLTLLCKLFRWNKYQYLSNALSNQMLFEDMSCGLYQKGWLQQWNKAYLDVGGCCWQTIGFEASSVPSICCSSYRQFQLKVNRLTDQLFFGFTGSSDSRRK